MTDRAIVVFGDVVDSRSLGDDLVARMRRLVGQLNRRHRADCVAPFDFTQGDEIQGLLSIDADPFASIVRVALDEMAPTLRWALAYGPVAAGDGPATQRAGPAFLDARRLIARTRADRVGLLVETGDPAWDPVLDDLAPILPSLLADLTPRQRAVARLSVVEGLRQAQVAELLGISRQTVSLTLARANLRSIRGLADGLQRIAQAAAGGSGAPGGAGTSVDSTTARDPGTLGPGAVRDLGALVASGAAVDLGAAEDRANEGAAR